MGKRLWSIIKRIILVILGLTIILVIANWELVVYGIRQGKGQLGIIWNAKPVEEVLADPAFPDSVKGKLRLIEVVRQYAVDSLGLKDTDNYRSLYDQKGKEVMWVVTAAKPYALEAKEWSFPIVGSVPYKGYFNQEMAEALAKELNQEGWDVNVRNPGGWSTLGWFNDPILSKMLERSEGDLANLIIHEMVHATIFVKDSVDFNENLASFIGDRGTEAFLHAYYGPDSDEYKEYMNDDRDYIAFVDHILRGTEYLKAVYDTIQTSADDIKAQKKREAIQHIVDKMDTLTLYSQKIPSRKFAEELPNNAYFMSFIHYQSGQEELWREWEEKFNKDLKQYIVYLSGKYPFL